MKLLLALALLVRVRVLVQWEISTVSGSDSVQCREDERSALLQIKAALSFSIHSSDGKWEGKECCRWERVTCDPITGHVTQLDLGISDYDVDWFDYQQRMLNATLFLPLHQLRSLSLSNHGIYNCTDGSGFESWSNLTKLQMLDLSENELPKSIISSLAKVSSLRALYLDSNNVDYNNVPVQELGVLNLEVISLRNCWLRSLPYLGHWSSLKALSLADNFLNDTFLLEGLCRLKNLEELDISKNNFMGNLPPCLGNLSSLKLVDLHDNNFQVKFPSSIFDRLVSLRYLSMSYNQLEGTLSMWSFRNHSNLEVLRLSTNFTFRVEVVDLPFQLQVLELANCILDVKPTFLYSQYKLQVLDLSNTGSKGLLSPLLLLLENNTNMIKLDLHRNFFTGTLQLPFLTHEKLSLLDISENHLGGQLPADISTKLPNLTSLDLSKNSFHGPLPLISISSLNVLDLSFNNLTDDIHKCFPRILSPFLSSLDLSNNQFYGSVTNHLNFTRAPRVLLLNDNNISGEIPFSICNTSWTVLDISNNELNGVLPNCIGRAEISILKLSGNHLEGPLPLEMCVVRGLSWIDLSVNKLSGSIPPCYNRSTLEIVDLSQNNLTGNFPITWLNISRIYAINIGGNHLSGKLPIWIGKESAIRMLQARENLLGGPIPKQICEFKYLRILDLSLNKLFGDIPPCIIDSGSTDRGFPYLAAQQALDTLIWELDFTDAKFLLHISYVNDGLDGVKSTNFQLELMSKGRLYFYLEEILRIQSTIDLSSNRLVGNIPEDIGRMNWLITLNLSNNQLTGAIPNSVSNLHLLESLDLSHNSLTGEIPRELTKITTLESFSVAYNNLSGPTLGVDAQFITFGNSSYEGNPNLCGPPLSKSCFPTLGPTQPSPIEMSDNQRYDGTNFLILFGSFFLFFVVSFWFFMVVLYFKRNWRYAFFTLVDQYGDMIYVKVVLSARKIRVALTRRGS